MKATEIILKEISDVINYQMRRRLTWMKLASQIEPLVDALEELGCEVGYYSAVTVRASGDRKLLAKIFRAFRLHGFRCTSERPKKNSTSWDGTFNAPGFETIFVAFCSTVCQMVQVGMKTVEVPIYEVRCGGSLNSEPIKPTLSEIDDDIPF